MDYERQQSANLLSFYTDEDMKHKKEILLRLVKAMKEENVTWAYLVLLLIFLGEF